MQDFEYEYGTRSREFFKSIFGALENAKKKRGETDKESDKEKEMSRCRY